MNLNNVKCLPLPLLPPHGHTNAVLIDDCTSIGHLSLLKSALKFCSRSCVSSVELGELFDCAVNGIGIMEIHPHFVHYSLVRNCLLSPSSSPYGRQEVFIDRNGSVLDS